ncbi:hypothetical protein [Aporhodopirellula aestuarii]|uniref:Uncharacterized protein n=1 Tax=Aporhodopirellula aestuarii TaxID=2950107 RepID=A0ABT0U0D3_9BACT|nr:hypothetical protein [Aporhodopirellula aestuarii]MCM2370295.1 hypothetical protein [Aporhodopirellula aestuarii]
MPVLADESLSFAFGFHGQIWLTLGTIKHYKVTVRHPNVWDHLTYSIG